MPSDLVIVYHRQPYEEVEENGKTVLRDNKSPNGIVPTLKSFFGKVDHGAWVAWKLAEDSNDPGWSRQIEVEDGFGSYSVSRLPLTQKQVHEFYHVTSKEAFWPILHSFKDRYNYDPVDWPNFREVNWRFAEAAAAEAGQGALVWVHDYNLWLVPGYLRQMRPDVKIAFFHHTPFPAPDMFNVLPWRREIVDSLMACDSVGFHIPRYATNFAAVVQSLMDVEITERAKVPDDLIAEGTALTERRVPTVLSGPERDVHLSVAPVGVDVDYIQKRAAEEATQTRAQELLADLGDRKLILSVGRTDYTKGGIEQLESFERVLEARPELRGEVQLMHVSVSANRGMAAYGEIQSAIEEIAGRINGRFGSLEWQPITLVSRAIPFKDLVAYYRAASIAWITPLADGMNLVAKEFIAARVDGDGALVLSEFAGAAVELGAAVATNPFSNRSMDVAIGQALDMSETERRDRMKAMQTAVRSYDLSSWGKSIEALLPTPRKSAA
ncbi:glucosylglycerol-phosphate synthase [Marivita sp.]|uniref:glucosylglycerol-phosphate synthase n=1 Tax=Marivita sp. TaxID=2003365 RepID=UPI0025C2E4BA|nr:glucosylglycerol-phosphate synthase [Marivita sp.]